jgi:hypothetical protein
MSKPVQMVAPDDWNVSFETSSAYEGATLHVFRVLPDEPNEFGGVGTIEHHPTHYGLRFVDVDEASWYAFEHGFSGLWSINYERLDEPFWHPRVDTVEIPAELPFETPEVVR